MLLNKKRNKNRQKLVIPQGVDVYYATTLEIEKGLDFLRRYQLSDLESSTYAIDVIDEILVLGNLTLEDLINKILIKNTEKYFSNNSNVFIKKNTVYRTTYLTSALREKLYSPSKSIPLANFLLLTHFSYFLKGSQDSFIFEDKYKVRYNEMRKGEKADPDFLYQLNFSHLFQFPNFHLNIANVNDKI